MSLFPGSVFKIPLATGALNDQKITPQTTFICKGFYRLGRRRFRCSHTHGVQNLIESIAQLGFIQAGKGWKYSALPIFPALSLNGLSLFVIFDYEMPPGWWINPFIQLCTIQRAGT